MYTRMFIFTGKNETSNIKPVSKFSLIFFNWSFDLPSVLLPFISILCPTPMNRLRLTYVPLALIFFLLLHFLSLFPHQLHHIIRLIHFDPPPRQRFTILQQSTPNVRFYKFDFLSFSQAVTEIVILPFLSSLFGQSNSPSVRFSLSSFRNSRIRLPVESVGRGSLFTSKNNGLYGFRWKCSRNGP